MNKKLFERILDLSGVLLEQEEREAWETTQGEFRYLNNKLWNKAVRPILNNIQRKAGKNAIDITKYYINKYDIKSDVKINFNSPLSGTVKGEAVKVFIPSENKVFYEIHLPYEEKHSLSDKDTLILRHEIEHILDYERGFVSTTGQDQKWTTEPDETMVGNTKHIPVSGHHKNYVYFDSDYVHKIIIRDAVKSGKKVPKEVLKDYPDLLTYPDVSEPTKNKIKDIIYNENEAIIKIN
jgi:hypothetical protein